MKSYSLLHINIQKKNHIENIRVLLTEKMPDFVCMMEVSSDDIKKFAEEFNYHYVHAPKFISKETNEGEGQGILSKRTLKNVRKQRYDNNKKSIVPMFFQTIFSKAKPKRPKEQFLFNETLLSAEVSLDSEKTLTIATTHFPVSDHSSPGLNEHELYDIESLEYVENIRNYFDRFLTLIKKLKSPLIFTADLNNPRGDFIYDQLAHELVDQIPLEINSSIDPELHRVKNLQLMVDTIMTSENLEKINLEVIEGVSDHKGFMVTFSLSS